MKANAPEKLWIDPATDLPKLSGHIDKDSVEYTRTDAFIEKAIKYIANHFLAPGMDNEIEDFRNYMKVD